MTSPFVNLLFSSPNDPFAALHARQVATPANCRKSFQHDRTAEILSILIIIGLVISYLPQHLRIIVNKTSDGFSPFFLLLGATSSASSLFNILSLQWGQVQCCAYLTRGQCIESLLGIGQIFFQWFCFNLMHVLPFRAGFFYPLAEKYIRYLPVDASYISASGIQNPNGAGPSTAQPFITTRRTATGWIPSFLRPSRSRSSSTSSLSSAGPEGPFNPHQVLLPSHMRATTITFSPSYRLSLSLFALTLLHFILTGLTTFILLSTLPGLPKENTPPSLPSGREHPSEKALRVWATTLGVVSVALACVQYLPQIAFTLRRKLVGSLSIPMMCLQTPGSFVFVYSLAVRPGVNWTGWGTYLVTGLLQGSLLFICLLWKARQKRLSIDDWGVAIEDERPRSPDSDREEDERTPLVR
ncbi:hypothetical protein T439DRAFT_339057 [Meredithblackwellia eburnea MCA 4105]